MSDKGKVLMPKELTVENGAKALLSGEFFEMYEYTCPECKGKMDAICEHCDDEGYLQIKIPIRWENIRAIYKKAVEELGENEHFRRNIKRRNMMQ